MAFFCEKGQFQKYLAKTEKSLDGASPACYTRPVKKAATGLAAVLTLRPKGVRVICATICFEAKRVHCVCTARLPIRRPRFILSQF